MGFNHKAVGFDSVSSIVESMVENEDVPDGGTPLADTPL